MNPKRFLERDMVRLLLVFLILPSMYPMLLLAEPVSEFPVVDHITCWPNLTLLPNGTILLAGFNKPSHGQVEGDVACWISTDEGGSWGFQGTLTQHDSKTVRMNQAVGLTKEGNLIALVSGWADGQQPGAPKRSVLRDKILGSWVCRSQDKGKNWVVTKDDFSTDSNGRVLIPFGDIILADDGSLRTAMYSTSYWNKPGPWAAFFVVSEDNGKTWRIKSEIAAKINETALLYLGEDQWLAAARGPAILLYRSGDDGKTWEFQGAATAKNQLPGHLLRLKDGRIVLTYGDRRKNHFGIGAIVSDDEGKTWGPPLVLTSMPSKDGGYPASVQLLDGRILTVYYSKKGELDDYAVFGTIWQAKTPSFIKRKSK